MAGSRYQPLMQLAYRPLLEEQLCIFHTGEPSGLASQDIWGALLKPKRPMTRMPRAAEHPELEWSRCWTGNRFAPSSWTWTEPFWIFASTTISGSNTSPAAAPSCGARRWRRPGGS